MGKFVDNQLPMVSVVIPIYNEIQSVEEVLARLLATFDNWNRRYEILFIDDGSTDGTREVIKAFPDRQPSVRSILLSRNFGQHAAVAAGFENARGDYIVTMDADLQVDPSDIPRLAEKLDEGYDIVAGYRRVRKEGLFTRRIPSLMVNKFFNIFLRLPYRDVGCSLQAMRKTIIDGVGPLSDMYTHRTVFAVWRGGRFAEIPISHRERQVGTTKYRFTNLAWLFFDVVLTFLTTPVQLVLFFVLGSILIGSASILALLLSGAFLTGSSVSGGSWIFSMFLAFSGLVFITFGLINERINRVNHKMQKTPLFVIDKIIENEPSITQESLK